MRYNTPPTLFLLLRASGTGREAVLSLYESAFRANQVRAMLAEADPGTAYEVVPMEVS